MPDRSLPLRLLFVDDDDYLCETMAVLLEDDDREVVTCASAETALPLWREGRFDVLVTDLALGGMSGLDLARQVLAEDPDAWIVLASGRQVDVGSLAPGRNVRTLAKPFETAALVRLLDSVPRR